MTEIVNTETTSLARELTKDMGIAVAQTAAGYVLAFGTLAAVGYIVEKRNARRAKKAVATEK